MSKKVSGYQKMILLVMFDMPTNTKGDIQKYIKFRKKLLSYGFIMFQFSVYVRFCKSLAIAQKYEKYVQQVAPNGGSIRVIRITENQYKNMIVIENYRKKPEDKVKKQYKTLSLF